MRLRQPLGEAPEAARARSRAARARSTLVRIGRPLGWGVADQLLSSVTNFALGIAVARSVPIESLGAFSIVFVSYLTAMSLVRALGSAPLVVRYSASTAARWRDGATSSTGLAVAVGVVLGVAAVAIGIVLHAVGSRPLGASLAMLGVCLPGLMLQDAWRSAFFARGTAAQAFVNDLVWAVLLAGAIGALTAAGTTGILWWLLAWGSTGTIAGVLGAAQAGLVPRPDRSAEWWRRHRDLSSRYVGEFAATQATQQASTVVIAGIAGLSVMGRLRAVTLLFGPVNIVVNGVALAATPEGVRLWRRAPHRLGPMIAAMAIALSIGAVAWGALLFGIPDGLGARLLGESWGAAHDLVPAATVFSIGVAVGAAARTGLGALAAARHSLRARLRTSPILFAGPLVGLAVGDGALGVAWGAAVAEVASSTIWVASFRRAVRDPRVHAERAAEPEPRP